MREGKLSPHKVTGQVGVSTNTPQWQGLDGRCMEHTPLHHKSHRAPGESPVRLSPQGEESLEATGRAPGASSAAQAGRGLGTAH